MQNLSIPNNNIHVLLTFPWSANLNENDNVSENLSPSFSQFNHLAVAYIFLIDHKSN
jgi:hypothetical protein